MKHGVHWRPLGHIGVDRLPPNAHCMGIRMEFDPDQKEIALSRGVWKWKRITVGRVWFLLTGEQQWATVLHEAGHCFGRHMEARLLMIPFFWMDWVVRRCAAQELEADLFAVRHGYGSALLDVVVRMGADGAYYPTKLERIRHLENAIIWRERHAIAA